MGRYVERLQRMKGNPANHNVHAIDALNAAVSSLKDMDRLRGLVRELDALKETALTQLDESRNTKSAVGVQEALAKASEALKHQDAVGQEILDLIRKSC